MREVDKGVESINAPPKLDLRSPDLAESKREELLRLFPEIRLEGDRLDFEKLKLVLGESIDVGKERYGMTWPGKADCFKAIQTPSIGTLRPSREESIDFDTTENLIIEGDNLEVLKLLQKSYLGKVKMIYIDPPYNTGNDFIYPDNYSESLQTYLEYTGQVDAEGKKFGTNTEADGRFHSKWLNMMYPRLYLARNLLSHDGLLFVSIDDGEVQNLRRLCDEIFGEDSFVAQFVWKSRVSEDTRAKTGVSTDHEYVICYSGVGSPPLRGAHKDLTKFSNPDNDARGPWRSADLTGLATEEARPNLHYKLINPTTGFGYECPPKGWRFDRETMNSKIAELRILWPANADGRPRHKLFLDEMKSQFKNLSSVWLHTNTAEGTRELTDILGTDTLAFPKPSALIRLIVEQATDGDDLVLDFFAGSGTTAQAVMEANRSDGSTRQFLLVQLPEPTQRDDYPTIASITKERVRRVIKTLHDDSAARLRLERETHKSGFRVFKLAESNFETWNADAPGDSAQLADQLDLHVEHIREGRTTDDLLYEILLKSGFPLTTPVEPIELTGRTVHSVANGALIVCLERKLTLELIRAIAEKRPERVVCLDAGYASNDQLKANAVQIFRTKGVVSFRTV